MLDQARARTAALQDRLQRDGIAVAVLTDESSIAWLAGFWGYLSVEFGRPTCLIVPADAPPTVLTPAMESEMVAAMTWVENVATWEDAGDNRWESVLGRLLESVPGMARPGKAWPGQACSGPIAIERTVIPAIVRNWFEDQLPDATLVDLSPVLGAMRQIKTPEEIVVMRQAGEIAGAMMQAAHDSLAEGVPEYESALAVINAGSRRAAQFLTDSGWEAFVSPMIHNLQILQSGSQTSMVHRRASVKPYARFDPVYFCFCNMAQFKQYKLGFDRMFHIGDVRDEDAAVQQAAIDAQQAAIAAIRPGVTAESIAQAADAVYAERGFATGYRTGRSIGVAYLETPELKHGDTTVLQAGMTFAVDGGISVDGQTAGRIGDSIVVTETGCEYLTDYPREILLSRG